MIGDDVDREPDWPWCTIEPRSPLIVRFDATGRCTWVSDAVGATTGHTSDQLLGAPLAELVDADADGADGLGALVNGETDRRTAAVRLRRPGGPPVSMTARVLSRGTGLDGHRDVIIELAPAGERTDQHRRAVSDSLLAAVVERAGDTIVLTRDGIVEWCSPAAAELADGTADDWAGRPLVDHVHPDDRPAVEAALADGARSAQRIRARFGAGSASTHWAEGRIHPFAAGDGSDDRRAVSSWRTIDDAVADESRLRRDEHEQRERARQLQSALESRIVIEQAKGVLAGERSISVDEAFAVLRDHARRNGRRLQEVASAVVTLGLRP